MWRSAEKIELAGSGNPEFLGSLFSRPRTSGHIDRAKAARIGFKAASWLTWIRLSYTVKRCADNEIERKTVGKRHPEEQ
jgi:hypothetical protein